MALMTGRGFQEEGEAAGKWRRALLTSTQLSTYFVGYTEVAGDRGGPPGRRAARRPGTTRCSATARPPPAPPAHPARRLTLCRAPVAPPAWPARRSASARSSTRRQLRGSASTGTSGSGSAPGRRPPVGVRVGDGGGEARPSSTPGAGDRPGSAADAVGRVDGSRPRSATAGARCSSDSPASTKPPTSRPSSPSARWRAASAAVGRPTRPTPVDRAGTVVERRHRTQAASSSAGPRRLSVSVVGGRAYRWRTPPGARSAPAGADVASGRASATSDVVASPPPDARRSARVVRSCRSPAAGRRCRRRPERLAVVRAGHLPSAPTQLRHRYRAGQRRRRVRDPRSPGDWRAARLTADGRCGTAPASGSTSLTRLARQRPDRSSTRAPPAEDASTMAHRCTTTDADRRVDERRLARAVQASGSATAVGERRVTVTRNPVVARVRPAGRCRLQPAR